MIEAVIFDMDGVLIDSEPLWKVAQKRAFGQVGLNMTTEMCNITMGFRTSEVSQYWFEKTPWAGKTPQEISDDMISFAMDEIKARGEAMKGVKETLNWLKNNNYKLALASSSVMRLIDVVVDKLEIRSYFDVIQSAEKEEYGKPHPAVFITTAKNLGLNPYQCLVIEDSANGVIAAKAAKMKVVAIPDPLLANDKRFAIAEASLQNMTQLTRELIESLPL
ncbi:MAG TPA: hexitol phosphatase HxpB [Cytophagaceae bacterium]|jgi:sugar-phosphatase